MRLTPLGSYEIWSDLVRSALVWAGVTDPCATIAEIRASDTRADALRAALAAWPSDEPATSGDLLRMAEADPEWRAALVEWLGTRRGDLPTSRAMGYALRAVRGRVVDGHRLVTTRDRTGVTRWSRTTAGDAGDEGHPPLLRAQGPSKCVGGSASPASPASPAREPGEDDDA